MKLLVWLLYLAQAVLASQLDPKQLYEDAREALATLPSKYDGVPPQYSQDNIDAGIYIPQYGDETHQYEGFQPPEPNKVLVDDIIPKLESAALGGVSEASVLLGDIYMFGNYSVATNYTRALDYYTEAVSRNAHGHAYFMLAFMYSTGLFGEVPQDIEKSNVYYEYAAQNDDFNALLVLANKHHHGIGRPQDCAVAQIYYSRAARVAMQHLHETGVEPAYETVPYNIKLPDFNGGLYGNHVTESDITVFSKVDNYAVTRNVLREGNLNSHDSDMAEYYFDALLSYYGGYFTERNTTRAFQDALRCAHIGDRKFMHKSLSTISDTDRYLWSRCSNLVGHMYIKGHGVDRDIARAYDWIKKTEKIYTNEKDMLDKGLLHQFDPTTDGVISPNCQKWLESATYNGSAHGAYLYSRYLIGSKQNPFETSYAANTYELIRMCAIRDHYESYFYLADAVESGFAASVGESYTCTDLVQYYKRFVERSESFLLPHLQYAFNEFKHANFKGALLGYLIAAEQGLSNAQVSASYLLFQLDPLLSFKRRTFQPSRVKSAINYLELASLQGDVDATVFLGDLYSGAVPTANITIDDAKAFAYYNKAALSASPHGCYKLGYMYEYGLGSANNTVDYYMAKRYYDFSIKYRQDHNAALRSLPRKTAEKANIYPVSLALLRLRLKLLWNRDQKDEQHESSSWFGTFKNLGKSQELEDEEDRATTKAQAYHEGGSLEDEEEEYEVFDYVVLVMTFLFFIYMFAQNVQRQVRRMRRGRNGEGANEENGENGNNGAIHIQGGNFEFFFFAV